MDEIASSKFASITHTMNDQERYLFDLQGFITVPNALSADELAELNRIFDEHIAKDAGAEKTTMRWGNLFSWGAPFRRLVANPRLTPYLEEILGKNFRLDHDYIDLIRSGKGPIGTTLHGGNTPFDPSQYYHWHNGRMHNGLTVVAYNLRDVNPGDGGFGCVPGSHKSNLPYPNEWRELDNLQPFMRAVAGPAGTAIIFTEALTHGTLPWHGKGERRTLFMKYSPHPVSWAAKYYDASLYDDWSESERGILEAPNARYKGR
jgi:ectoine hydroxylase-related dioxygenase (phytanoyl-CoA dioxygenase family)